MSPFLAAFLGGLVGGVVCGLVLGALLAVFGPPIAERLLHKQVTFLEARLKENILEVAFGRIGAFLDQSERIGRWSSGWRRSRSCSSSEAPKKRRRPRPPERERSRRRSCAIWWRQRWRPSRRPRLRRPLRDPNRA
jgi:hypothetical protein